MKLLWRAFVSGLKDGWRQPYDLTSGLTWENDHRLNLAYDHGVNYGQATGVILNALHRVGY